MSGYAVDRTKWKTLSLFEQMGNIYSEVGRTIGAKRRQDEESYQASLARALDLLAATAEVWAVQKPSRTKEILRAKEVFLAALEANDLDQLAKTDRYFADFAIAARLRK